MTANPIMTTNARGNAASVHEHIADARQTLERAGLTAADARLDAEVLARHVLDWDRARLVADGREPMPADAGARYAGADRASRDAGAGRVHHRPARVLGTRVRSLARRADSQA